MCLVFSVKKVFNNFLNSFIRQVKPADDQDYFNFVIKEVSLLRKKIDTFKYSLGNKHPIADTKYSNKANKLKKDIYFLNLDK